MKPTSFALLALLALPFFVALEDSSVWDTSEAYYAQTPREMIDRGDWLVPYFNGQPRVNKPPLSYWIVASCYRLFSDSLFWERLPMALLAYGSVLIVFWIGRILFAEEVALWGAAIFATTPRFLILGRQLFVDILMLFCILAAIAFFLSWLKGGKRNHFLLSALFFGLAFLAKGPLALLPLAFLGLYLALTGQLTLLVRAPWVVAGVVFLVISMPWFLLLALRSGGQPVIDFFLVENLSRFTHLALGPERGPFYYLGVFLGDFFPWSLFFVAALVWWLTKGWPRTQPISLLLCWILVYFLVFSFSYNKQEQYILPLYPAAALCVAFYLRENRVGRVLVWGVSILTSILGVLLYLIVNKMFFDVSFLWIPPLFVAGFALLVLFRRFGWALACLALFYVAGFSSYLEPFEQYRPVHHFAERLRAEMPEGETVRGVKAGYYKFACPSLAFHLNRPILELHKLEEAVTYLESEEQIYLIVGEEHYPPLQRAVSRRLQIVEVRPKLYTTAETIMEGVRSGGIDAIGRHQCNAWTRPVYLISN